MTKVKNTLVNKDFTRAVKVLRRILPKLAFGLLIATYLISAGIMVIPHVKSNEGMLMVIGSILIHLAIQAGRGTLIFFFQLNPARYQSRFSMALIAATLLLILSMWNAYIVFEPYGLGWIVSVNTLMLIGYIIEIMILRETMFATNMELYQNKAQWAQLKEFYIAKEQFENFMEALNDGKVEESYYVKMGNGSQPGASALEPNLAKKEEAAQEPAT